MKKKKRKIIQNAFACARLCEISWKKAARSVALAGVARVSINAPSCFEAESTTQGCALQPFDRLCATRASERARVLQSEMDTAIMGCTTCEN